MLINFWICFPLFKNKINLSKLLFTISLVSNTAIAAPLKNKTEWTPNKAVAERYLSEETEAFLSCCVAVTLISFTWLNYYVIKSAKKIKKFTSKYNQWYSSLEQLEIESKKWHSLYWTFEQNNMILQRLDSPRYWPVKPIKLAITPIEFKDRSRVVATGIKHEPPDIYHAIRPRKQSALNRLLTDPEYFHSVELYTKQHQKSRAGGTKVKAVEGDWTHFRTVGCDNTNSTYMLKRDLWNIWQKQGKETI